MENFNTTEVDHSLSSQGEIDYEHTTGWEQLPFSNQEHCWTLGWVAASGGILCLGAVGNAYVLYAGLKRKKLRTSQFYVLLLNHSLVCLLLDILPYPIMLYKGSTGLVKTKTERNFCSLSKVLLLWLVNVELFSNALVAVNRALSCFPHLSMSATKYGHRITAACVALIWILSGLVYAVPALLYPTGWEIDCFPVEKMIKYMNDPKVNTIGNTIKYTFGTSVLVALLISVISYAIIVLRLYCPVCFRVNTAANQRRRKKAQALGIIALLCCTFVTCWAPLVWAIIMRPEDVGKPFYSMMAMLETILNPVLYIVTMSAFRPRLCVRNNSVTTVANT